MTKMSDDKSRSASSNQGSKTAQPSRSGREVERDKNGQFASQKDSQSSSHSQQGSGASKQGQGRSDRDR